ncbi:MAG: hypothetical protein DRO98_05780 [Archaeoglobales archaeon]|nr:MAG: hypothetical protein DRO98_05780 [Archaeoglobales archaeon]
MRDWVLVWISFTIPLVFMVSTYSMAYLWGFGSRLIQRLMKQESNIELKNLGYDVFKEFFQQSVPYILCMYFLTGTLLLAEFIIIHKQYSHNYYPRKLLTAIFLCPFLILILALPIFMHYSVMPWFVPWLVFVVYAFWIFSWWLPKILEKFFHFLKFLKNKK